MEMLGVECLNIAIIGCQFKVIRAADRSCQHALVTVRAMLKKDQLAMSKEIRQSEIQPWDSVI